MKSKKKKKPLGIVKSCDRKEDLGCCCFPFLEGNERIVNSFIQTADGACCCCFMYIFISQGI
jgi:hypothetical protein